MSLRILIVTILAAFVLWASTSSAQVVSARGQGTVVFEGRLGPEERQAAMTQAKIAALESHVAESSRGFLQSFNQRRAEFVSNIDRYVLSATSLSEAEDRKAKTFSVVLRVELNQALLRADLEAGSAVGQVASAERSLVALLFMARRQSSVQAFDDRVHQRADTRTAVNASEREDERTREGESISASSIATSGSVERGRSGVIETSVSTTTGGSTIRKADAVVWDVGNASEINSAMTGVLSTAGFEVVEAEYVEGESGGQLDIERIRQDFSTGSDLSPEVLRATVAGVRTAQIPLLAFGTMDVGMRDRDPVTGNTRVHVTVTGKVMDVSGRFPRTLASVGPVQFAGLGPDESVARTNALLLAGEKAAQQVVDALNARQVR
jgi:hypothetical protein